MNLQCEPYKANARGWTRCNLMNVSSWTRNISSQIDPEVRPWKNSSNAILLPGKIFLLGKYRLLKSALRKIHSTQMYQLGVTPQSLLCRNAKNWRFLRWTSLLPRCFNWCHQRTPPIAFSYSQFKTNLGSTFISRNLYMTCILATQSITFYRSHWHLLLLRLTRPKSWEKASSNRGC